MSLPAGQQRILDGIAETMRLTEPRLTMMFGIFTRLTKNEPTPAREQLVAAKRRARAAPWRPLLAWRRERPGPAWRRAMIISQVAIAFIVLVVLTVVTSHSAAACGGLQPRPDAISASHQQACLAPVRSGVGLAGK
jgi:hypothetical protein